MTNLFVYGSLIYPEVWRPLVSKTYRASPAFLPHYSRHSVLFDSYPIAFANRQACGFLGKAYFDVSLDDLRRLDEFEGPIYEKTGCEVLTPTGAIMVQMYLPKAQFQVLARSDHWNPRLFRHIQFSQFLARHGQLLG